MNEFEKLLDAYLDDDLLYEKYSLDVEEIKKEQPKTGIRLEGIDEISIYEFVNDYLGIKNNCYTLSHKILKSFDSPYVVGLPNEFVYKHFDSFKKREILVVRDTEGNLGTYLNPKLLKNVEEYKNLKYKIDTFRKYRIQSLENISKIYKKYNEVLKQLRLLEKEYDSDCVCLKQLGRKYLIKEIEEYVLETNKMIIENEEALLELLNVDIKSEIDPDEIVCEKEKPRKKVKRKKDYAREKKNKKMEELRKKGVLNDKYKRK